MKKKLLAGLATGVMMFGMTGVAGAAPVITDGLVAAYEFNGNANDSSGNGNDGSPVGGVTWTTGVQGGAVRLDGTGYINVPDSPSLDLPGGNGTISAFVRVDPSSDDFGIVVKESSSSFASTIAYEFTLRGGSSRPLSMLTSDGSNTGAGSNYGAGLADLAWHHVAATWIPDDIRLYIDGGLVYQGNEREAVYTINNTADPVLIGAFRWNVGGQFRYMTGDMDEVYIYDRALSGTEIGTLANPVPVPAAVWLLGSGLVGLAGLRRKKK